MQRSIIGCVGEIIRVRCSVSIVAAQVSQLNMQISEGGGGSRGQDIVRDTQIAHLLTLLTFANFESHWDILSEQLLLIYIYSENHDMDDSFVLMN